MSNQILEQWIHGGYIPPPDAIAIQAERHAILYAAIDRLPSAQRAVVLLHLQGRSHAEIARLRKVAYPTVRRLLNMGRIRLGSSPSVVALKKT